MLTFLAAVSTLLTAVSASIGRGKYREMLTRAGAALALLMAVLVSRDRGE